MKCLNALKKLSMSASLNEMIELYLNDIADYDEENLLLAESVLKPVKQLLTEGKLNEDKILIEAYRKSNTEQKAIIEDFLTYIKEST